MPSSEDYRALVPVRTGESGLKPAATPRKWTPSMCSFGSDNTCLGEIPDSGTVDQRISNVDEAIDWREVQGTVATLFCNQALMPA